MFISRDIFRLKFGHYRDVKALLDREEAQAFLTERTPTRVFTDFTGESYRLIFEHAFSSLAEYEELMQEEFAMPEWQAWYAEFKPHIKSSYRELLRQII